MFQEYELRSTSYRRYLGIVFAVLILIVGYAIWRSTQHSSESSLAVPPTTPATTEQPAAPTSIADSQKSGEPAQNIVASPRAAEPVHDNVREKTAAERTGTQRVQPTAVPASTVPSAGNLQTQAISGSGAEEFAIAQSYLNGTGGYQRNSTEAVGWLWKAVAKHNGDATLLLSDLYLKGDGVSKNCDQARVLLDAAARKGMKDAGERLRHLQAFGCE